MACDVVIVRESINTLWKKLPRHNVLETLEDLERTRYYGKPGLLFVVVNGTKYFTMRNLDDCAKKDSIIFYGQYVKKQIHCSYVMASKRPQSRPLTEYRIVAVRRKHGVEIKSRIYLYE